jgi:hypothetical protein
MLTQDIKRTRKNFIMKVVSSDGQTLTAHEDKAAEFAAYYRALLAPMRT